MCAVPGMTIGEQKIRETGLTSLCCLGLVQRMADLSLQWDQEKGSEAEKPLCFCSLSKGVMWDRTQGPISLSPMGDREPLGYFKTWR